MSKEEPFLNKAKFSVMIEEFVWETGSSYIDAIVELCKDLDIDIEDANKFVSPIVKGKLEAEAQSLNLIPKTNNNPLEF